jgi:uncharacterized membrane protein YgcG
MTEPHGNGPMDPEEELATLAGLDLALDELTGGRDVWTERVGGEIATLAAVAAALVVVVALPAAARQARPGTTLWPVREIGQGVRDRLADGPVDRARLRLGVAESYLAAGRGAGEERRKDMADQAEERIKHALDVLDDGAGPEAEAQRARARRLLAQVDALEHQKDPGDRSGPGSGSGIGGGAESGSGSGSGPGSGSGSGTSGSGSGSSGSRRSGPGDG